MAKFKIVHNILSSIKKIIFPSNLLVNCNNYVCDVVDNKDVLHPCVRFIESGFRGHQWWMVYTPYPNFDSKQENPILCYSESIGKENPTKWIQYMNIIGPQLQGYNSDPSILFAENSLYITWRECFTPKTNINNNAFETYCCCLKNDNTPPIYFEQPLLTNKVHYQDFEISPNFDYYDGKFMAYAINFSLRSKYTILNKIKCSSLGIYISIIFNLFGINIIRKSNGITIWSGLNMCNSFCYIKTVKPSKIPWYYELWHSDIFHYGDDLYFVFQSNESKADILLGKLTNEKLSILKKPLISANAIDNYTIYKPSVVINDNYLYLFYTIKCNGINTLHLYKSDLKKLII